MKRVLGFLAVLLSLWLCSGPYRQAGASLAVPTLRGSVNDEAGLLSARQRSTLESMLRSFEEKTTTQVVLLTISSLEGDSLEEFSIRVVEEWKIGQKGKDNGVLFLVVVQDRKARIEVGYGLEGVLTDAESSQILRQIVLPAFKQGNYFSGIAGGLDAILRATEGEFGSSTGLPGTAGERGKASLSGLLLFLVFLLLLSSRLGRLMLLGGFLGSRMPSGRSFRGRGSGGSGGFGGFSGGGGGFGGGGASGSW